MLKLAKLNIEINTILDFYIAYNGVVNNFKYNDNWVTDINHYYFEKRKEEIENLIDENIDYEDEKNLLFLEDIFNSIIYKIELLSEHLDDFSSFNFDKINWPSSLDYPSLPPNYSPLDLKEPSPSNHFDDRFEYIIEIIKGFFNISPVNETSNNQEGLNETLLISPEIDEMDLEPIYAKAHLTYILSLHIEMLKEIAVKIENILKVVDIRKSYIEQNHHGDLGLENVKLEFNISKNHLGHLFYNLYEIGIIAKDKTDTKDKRTKLKDYINSANMYYFDDNKSKYFKASKMTRAMKVTRNIESKVVQDEISFLESFVSKLNTRLDSLNEILENLQDRGH